MIDYSAVFYFSNVKFLTCLQVDSRDYPRRYYLTLRHFGAVHFFDRSASIRMVACGAVVVEETDLCFIPTRPNLEKQLIFDHGAITFELSRANKSLN